ncbi:HIT family protein [Agaricicola taiwanensis]|uniref:HIT family protein n=1 Tax=Agaricicola taiwanensis TaxID=591372 RepID=A0A8J2YDA9_9RHOB|nr:HIT family protein [Agaricicola taiwanensis]GGE33370.1 HIT family protein [Agaricicola taiwanensis]
MLKSTIEIDRRLAADTVYVSTLALSQVRLMDDARFPWVVLVPKSQATELTDLSPLERGALMEEIATVSHVLGTTVSVDKINVGALGNIVSQLHVHVVGRRHGDAAWPGPVWGSGEAEKYEPTARDALVNKLAEALNGPAEPRGLSAEPTDDQASTDTILDTEPPAADGTIER